MTQRSCGPCSACCKPFAVPEVGKLTADWCTHCIKGKGCAIYDTRPPACRLFTCLWLQGQGDESDRPDILGVMMSGMHATVRGRRLDILQVIEIDEGALERLRVQEIIGFVVERGVVVMTKRQVSPTEYQPETITRRGLLTTEEHAALAHQLQDDLA